MTDEVCAVAERMLLLMHEAGGVGLAAPQVNLDWRLFVANPTGEEDGDRIYINPVLTETSEQTESREEGCLSIPGVNGEIRRHLGATIEAVDTQGKPIREQAAELPARVWQHECDHLDAVLIMDRMTALDRQDNRQTLKDLEQQYAATQ